MCSPSLPAELRIDKEFYFSPKLGRFVWSTFWPCCRYAMKLQHQQPPYKSHCTDTVKRRKGIELISETKESISQRIWPRCCNKIVFLSIPINRNNMTQISTRIYAITTTPCELCRHFHRERTGEDVISLHCIKGSLQVGWLSFPATNAHLLGPMTPRTLFMRTPATLTKKINIFVVPPKKRQCTIIIIFQ